ncbi:MAG: hypothetical protein LUG16_06575 [Candidatus Gastranaerophilales bacterium]|nr:hypothetical protein [Candidatus Gastranaerophilales bacterium]
MSFGINGPDNLPAIQKAHHTNDGGAGNLGYFQQNKKKEKKKNDKNEEDVFEFSGKNDEDTELETETFELNKIGLKIKNFWIKLHAGEKKPEENT